MLPSLFILIGLSWVYMAHGQVPAVAGLFHGIKPAVTALVGHAASGWSGSSAGRAPWHR
nr:chromate transporter [Pelomonas sp. KK5]